MLIAAGANVKATDKAGNTVLCASPMPRLMSRANPMPIMISHVAMMEGQGELARMLLEDLGAEDQLAFVNRAGKTPVEVAKGDVVAYLRRAELIQ